LAITDPNALATLGNEADRLAELFNAGLHANPTRENIEAAFSELLSKVVFRHVNQAAI
jgi:hypothetical protein